MKVLFRFIFCVQDLFLEMSKWIKKTIKEKGGQDKAASVLEIIFDELIEYLFLNEKMRTF